MEELDIDKEVKASYDKYTNKFSDICRNITFALLAFVWLFYKNTSNDNNIYSDIFWKLIIYLIIDASQYLFTVLASFGYYHIFVNLKNKNAYMCICSWLSFLIFIGKFIFLMYILVLINSNLADLK